MDEKPTHIKYCLKCEVGVIPEHQKDGKHIECDTELTDIQPIQAPIPPQ